MRLPCGMGILDAGRVGYSITTVLSLLFFAVAEAPDCTVSRATPALTEVEFVWICSSAGFRQVFPSTVRLVGYADRQICGPCSSRSGAGWERGCGRWGLVSPVPGCGTRREEDSLLTRCGDDQSGRACFLGKLCWFFVSVEASVFVVDLCALCPLLGVYFGTGGMDLSRVNTTSFIFTFHARRRRHY